MKGANPFLSNIFKKTMKDLQTYRLCQLAEADGISRAMACKNLQSGKYVRLVYKAEKHDQKKYCRATDLIDFALNVL